ncbi:MAG: outer membrane lipoprotein-sorting protein [bacterium]|nr:outer membrane lipoprotein-sorting protein [bacterium]
MKIMILLSLWLLTFTSLKAAPEAMSIVRKMDQSLNSKNQVITSTMVIHGKRATRSIESKSWILGKDQSFTEYLAPARERGTKMLKLGDQLWIYYPSADRVVNISGHMLRREVMGSDMSYEDMMERRPREELYEALLEGEEEIQGRPVYRILLSAQVPDVAYQKIRLWVDKERYVPLRQELFAASGKLLKVLETLEVMQTTKGWYPQRMRFKDVLKSGQGTEFTVEELLFDQEIPESRFHKGQLRR